jgi:N-acetylmuramic acid 6-phosphate etherase
MYKDGYIVEESITEQANPATLHIDTMDSLEIVTAINKEDQLVADAVQKILPRIARAVDIITERVKRGGRLLYFGAGTSGRLGILDASECPPTFGVEKGLVRGFIAGGKAAITCSIEGAEDNAEKGVSDAIKAKVTEKDTVVGITASGQAPYVLAVLKYAKEKGAATLGVCNVENPKLAEYSLVVINPIVGAEAISGSTRMKAGTSQKMVLNMLSTATMIHLGKTYGNLMIDMIATNNKLRKRAIRIVTQVTRVDEEEAAEALSRCGWNTKIAIVSLLLRCPIDEASSALKEAGGTVSGVLELYKSKAAVPRTEVLEQPRFVN